MKTGMHIGTIVDPVGVEAMAKAIIDILGTGVEQKTLRHALDALSKMSAVTGVSVSNVTISGASGNGVQAGTAPSEPRRWPDFEKAAACDVDEDGDDEVERLRAASQDYIRSDEDEDGDEFGGKPTF